MRSAFILLCTVFFLNTTFAQTGKIDSTVYAATIKQQADSMAQFLLKKEYNSFCKYTYPEIIKMAGGKDKLVAALKDGIEKMEAGDFKFSKIDIGEPSVIVKKDNELQCTVPEILEMKIKDGRLVTKSTLIAVSKDNGKKWYFIDTQGKDIATLKKQLPNLSGALVVPPRQQPTVYKD